MGQLKRGIGCVHGIRSVLEHRLPNEPNWKDSRVLFPWFIVRFVVHVSSAYKTWLSTEPVSLVFGVRKNKYF